ncbi:hypothetical protein [Streptosporangium subroseum]|uniref:hypothetical protein n=1 Tax=Streptosporangium subroseum TaxID=106412 RepID=UPI003B833BBF
MAPRERNKTLTALAEAEPVIGATHREVQRLQWFLSESPWEHEPINDQRRAAGDRHVAALRNLFILFTADR